MGNQITIDDIRRMKKWCEENAAPTYDVFGEECYLYDLSGRIFDKRPKTMFLLEPDGSVRPYSPVYWNHE